MEEETEINYCGEETGRIDMKNDKTRDAKKTERTTLKFYIKKQYKTNTFYPSCQNLAR